MNYAIKLLIPLGFGLAAAVINWIVLTSGTREVLYVTVSQPLDVGDRFVLEYAEPLAVPATFKDLSQTIVPFADRGVLSGRVVRRRIEAGDPVFFADTDLGGKWLDLQPNEELYPVSLDQVAVDPELLRIGNQIRFRVPPIAGENEPPWIGPFRIVAVGSKINNNFSEDRSIGSAGSLSVGIAYDATRNQVSLARLEAFCDLQRRGEATLLGVRIVDTR
ncbi:MAG: hypothetical protein AB7F89_00070 [Pirellulaceae bacterium]